MAPNATKILNNYGLDLVKAARATVCRELCEMAVRPLNWSSAKIMLMHFTAGWQDPLQVPRRYREGFRRCQLYTIMLWIDANQSSIALALSASCRPAQCSTRACYLEGASRLARYYHYRRESEQYRQRVWLGEDRRWARVQGGCHHRC